MDLKGAPKLLLSNQPYNSGFSQESMRANEAPRQCIQRVLSDEQGTETETVSIDWVTEGDVPCLLLILLTEAVLDEKRVTAS